MKAPPWLRVDLTPEEVCDYFSARVLKDLTLSEHSPASMNCSLLLDSFQQFFHVFKSLKTNNRSLYERFDNVTKRNKTLEAELHRYGGARRFEASPRSDLNAADYQLKAKMRHLEGRVAEVEAVKRSYARSEQRCKQLVVLTQEWGMECDQKDKLIGLQDEEVKQLSSQVVSLGRRLSKYKRFWVDHMDSPNDGRWVKGSQFEELSSELAMRRELYDQVSEKGEKRKKNYTITFPC